MPFLQQPLKRSSIHAPHCLLWAGRKRRTHVRVSTDVARCPSKPKDSTSPLKPPRHPSPPKPAPGRGRTRSLTSPRSRARSLTSPTPCARAAWMRRSPERAVAAAAEPRASAAWWSLRARASALLRRSSQPAALRARDPRRRPPSGLSQPACLQVLGRPAQQLAREHPPTSTSSSACCPYAGVAMHSARNARSVSSRADSTLLAARSALTRAATPVACVRRRLSG